MQCSSVLHVQLVKYDTKCAYYLELVHRQDCLLLGLSWKGQVYVDGTLPFSLWSAPELYTVFVETHASVDTEPAHVA